MKKFQLFLASSINEFKNERTEIGNFFRKVENELIDYDIRTSLFECEFCDNSIENGRMQEKYNEVIRISDVFIMLVGKNARRIYFRRI